MATTPEKTIDADAQAQNPDTAKDAPHKAHKKTLGHHIHNELTYRGVDWLANSALGVSATYGLARTKRGEKYFNGIRKGFEFVLSPVFKEKNTLAEGAKWGASFLTIMVGGFAIIPPMLALENKDNKKGIIRWFDEKIYGKDKVANDPRFQESYDKIDKEPKKGFMTGMWARGIAIAPLIVLSSWPRTNKILIKHIYDPIGTLTKSAAKKIGIWQSEHMLDPKFGRPEHLDGDPKSQPQMQSNSDFLHRTIGFDFGLTIFYAILHEMAFKALAKHKEKKHMQDAATHAAPQTPAQEPLPNAEPQHAVVGQHTAAVMEAGRMDSPFAKGQLPDSAIARLQQQAANRNTGELGVT